MITEDDSHSTYEFEDHFAILSPALLQSGVYRNIGKKVEEGFRFSSDNNKVWHTDESFLKVLNDHGLLA
jgi:UDP-N-acetylglucosamine 4,6-dehydratase/5-epimerase